MAWILALGFFLWIGQSLAKHVDNVSEKEFDQGRASLARQEKFFVNLYIVAWFYYQQLEPQVIAAWEESHPRDYTLVMFSSKSHDFQTQTFGQRADFQAISMAWKDLREHGFEVYRENPNIGQRQEYGHQFVQVGPYEDITPESVASGLSADSHGKVMQLDSFFQFEYAAQATDPYVLSFLPEIDDPRVAYFTIDGHRFKRDGVPEDYEERIDRVKHPRKTKTYVASPPKTYILQQR